MVQVCPRCQRANPDPAVFCWFDGVVLRQGAAAAANTLPHEFVFPSGRRCRTFDELVAGCQYEWEDARDLLRKGDLGNYLAHIGRHDLARSATEAQAQADPDIALHQFLTNLPASQGVGPRLDLNPRRLGVGPVCAGEQRQLTLTISKQGTGLLQGKVTVSEGREWLKVAEGADGTSCAVKTARAQQVGLTIDARGLAAPRAYSGKLTVITNGGIAEVPVRLEVAVLPFGRPPFQGAASPRAMAERMRANPKPAVALLESGEVARWFRANGWTYPVAGATAKGVAAVQQFFEGMGLSKPPPLQLSEEQVRLLCENAEPIHGRVVLRTASKKWVYAQAEADVPWLKITTPTVSGPQQAAIAFEVDPSRLESGRIHEGTVQLVANAGQRLVVRVQVEVRRPHESLASRLLRPFVRQEAIRQRETTSKTSPERERREVGVLPSGGLRSEDRLKAELQRGAEPPVSLPQGDRREGLPHGLLRSVFAGALVALVLRLLLAAPADVYARGLSRPAHEVFAPAAGDEEVFLRPFVLATWWLGCPIGVGLVWRRGGKATDLFCAAVAGAAAGLAGSATLGCLLLGVDAVPGTLMARLIASRPEASWWYWLPLWVTLTSLCWALAGAALALVLSVLGWAGLSWGPRTLGALTAPAAWLFRACGLERAASFFLLQG
jgi:hypothetical protein